MPSLLGLLRQSLNAWRLPTALRPNVDLEFREYCRAQFAHQSQLLSGVILALTVALWPAERLVLRRFPALHAPLDRCCLGVALACAAYLLLPRRGGLMRQSFWLCCAVAGICGWLAGATAGQLGGPERPFLHLLPGVLVCTALLPLGPGRRVLITLLLAVALAAGYLIPHPEYWASPYLFLAGIVFGCMALLSVGVGHGQFRLRRENFHQAHRLAAESRFADWRIEERTRELRRLLRRLETAREAERTRIARELHDELGQELSALRYALGFTRQRYQSEPGAIAANLEELESLLRRTAATTRSLVSELRPRVLDDLGLPAAVQWLVERLASRSGLAIRVNLAPELPSIDARIATAAFRVIQEALTNVVRHAAARSVEVEVTTHDGRLELRVTDDGIGLRAAKTRGSRSGSGGGHVGLIGMRERSHALGGQVEVTERPSGGTQVRCVLPLTPPPEEDEDGGEGAEPAPPADPRLP